MTDQPTPPDPTPPDARPAGVRAETPALYDATATATETPPSQSDPLTILDMIWPETGLPVSVRVDRRPTDTISEDDVVHLELDFVTLAISPLEFIQLAASLRMSVDALLDQHPGLQRAVIAAFDLRRDDR
jgi:hypothetical protein